MPVRKRWREKKSSFSSDQESSATRQAWQKSLSSTHSSLLSFFSERGKARLVLLLFYLRLMFQQRSFLLISFFYLFLFICYFISWPPVTIDFIWLSRLLQNQGIYLLHKVLLPNFMCSVKSSSVFGVCRGRLRKKLQLNLPKAEVKSDELQPKNLRSRGGKGPLT